jgi:hypothetical protein
MKRKIKIEFSGQEPKRQKIDDNDLSYLFVSQPQKSFNKKEKNIFEYLNNKGIFQIHLGMAMEEF